MANKVAYLVTNGHHSSLDPRAVFTTLEAAKAYGTMLIPDVTATICIYELPMDDGNGVPGRFWELLEDNEWHRYP